VFCVITAVIEPHFLENENGQAFTITSHSGTQHDNISYAEGTESPRAQKCMVSARLCYGLRGENWHGCTSLFATLAVDNFLFW
jgi:hypothetical protein